MYGVRHVSQDGESSKESTCQSLRLGPTPKLSITVEGIEVKALVDTGYPATTGKYTEKAIVGNSKTCGETVESL